MPLKIKWNAPIILGFALLCTMVYFADIFMGGYLMPFFTVQPNISLVNPLAIMTLFTHVAGHASLEHLLGNLTFILLLGPIVEEKYGSNKSLQMILVTALITGLASIFIFKIGLLGASGIVFMLILLVSFTNVKSGEIPITFILVAILFLGKEFINGVQSNQIAESAHIIGGICGGIFGFNGGNIRQ